MSINNITIAELNKLRTLPVAIVTVIATFLTGILIGAVYAASALTHNAPVTTVEIALQAVPYLQIGFVLLGILPVTQEYASRQIHVSLTAVPNRKLLVVGKTMVVIVSAATLAIASVGASYLAATLTRRFGNDGASGATGELWQLAEGELLRLAGAAVYLTLIGLLSHLVALLVRHLIPALAGMLSLVLVVSPLLAGVTEHARWLPDRAAALLYGGTDAVLTAGTGVAIAIVWMVAVGGVAAVLFVRRDA